MDKFTKTTEIDISSMNDSMEEATPKKNKSSKIIAMILSLVVAFGIWVYVLETDTTVVKDLYENIPVIGMTDVYVNVWVEGTNSQLADVKAEYIEVTKSDAGYKAQIVVDRQVKMIYKCTVEEPKAN